MVASLLRGRFIRVLRARGSRQKPPYFDPVAAKQVLVVLQFTLEKATTEQYFFQCALIGDALVFVVRLEAHPDDRAF